MTDDLRDAIRGFTVSEWIESDVHELAGDGVGLFGIIDSGRRAFDLDGPALEAFVRRYLLALTEAGARPVLGGGGKGPLPWILQPQYGSTPHEIVESVIAEWRASGEDPDAGGLWFATPKVYQRRRS